MHAEYLWISLLLYPIVLLIAGWIHRREARESPEKGERYARLPVRIKAICWV